MNNKIIEVLDYLGEKIGLAIDWSSNNVYPQVMEFLGRYRTYEMVTNGIWMLVCMAYIVFVFMFIKKVVIPDRQKALDSRKDSFWWDVECRYSYVSSCEKEYFIKGVSCDAILPIVFGGTLFVMCIIGLIYCGCDIAKWIFIPEAQFYHLISGIMQ